MNFEEWWVSLPPVLPGDIKQIARMAFAAGAAVQAPGIRLQGNPDPWGPKGVAMTTTPLATNAQPDTGGV